MKKYFLLPLTLAVVLILSFEAYAFSGLGFATKLSSEYHLNPKVYDLAMKAYEKAKAQGIGKKEFLTIIDYSLPSTKPRMWVLDLKSKTVKFYTYVAHGAKTGMNKAKYFSNVAGSKASSLGLFLTEDTYVGSKGYSLNLKGLEPGINDNAYSRRIVIHGAHYVNENYINYYGRLGRSWGCPAVSDKLAKPIIDTIKGGSLVFSYFPDKEFLAKSNFVGSSVV